MFLIVSFTSYVFIVQSITTLSNPQNLSEPFYFIYFSTDDPNDNSCSYFVCNVDYNCVMTMLMITVVLLVMVVIMVMMMVVMLMIVS